jgi:hypothetical protein
MIKHSRLLSRLAYSLQPERLSLDDRTIQRNCSRNRYGIEPNSRQICGASRNRAAQALSSSLHRRFEHIQRKRHLHARHELRDWRGWNVGSNIRTTRSGRTSNFVPGNTSPREGHRAAKERLNVWLRIPRTHTRIPGKNCSVVSNPAPFPNHGRHLKAQSASSLRAAANTPTCSEGQCDRLE